MKCSDEDYTRQVIALIAIIFGIWALGFILTAAFADHSLFDYDVGIDWFRGFNDDGIISLEATVTNYGNEHMEFAFALYINDKFIAEKFYLLGVGQYIDIKYQYDARHLGTAVQNFDAEVWSELDQNPENDWDRAYVTTGQQV